MYYHHSHNLYTFFNLVIELVLNGVFCEKCHHYRFHSSIHLLILEIRLFFFLYRKSCIFDILNQNQNIQ